VVVMYDVVLLVEEELSVPDAERLMELYASAPDRVRFHLIIPCEDGKNRVHSSLAGLAGTELYGIAAIRYSVGSDEEVVVLARPHIGAEFFHVDWSTQARRHLGVPVLHLLEQHQDSPLEPGR
jgi:hypothetical protein